MAIQNIVDCDAEVKISLLEPEFISGSFVGSDTVFWLDIANEDAVISCKLTPSDVVSGLDTSESEPCVVPYPDTNSWLEILQNDSVFPVPDTPRVSSLVTASETGVASKVKDLLVDSEVLRGLNDGSEDVKSGSFSEVDESVVNV